MTVLLEPDGADHGILFIRDDHAVGLLIDPKVVRIPEDVRQCARNAIVHGRQRFIEHASEGKPPRVQWQLGGGGDLPSRVQIPEKSGTDCARGTAEANSDVATAAD